MKKLNPIVDLIIILLLSGCASPGYQCPLHDAQKACLSELQAYQTALIQTNARPAENLPYVIETQKPTGKTQHAFSWWGKINT